MSDIKDIKNEDPMTDERRFENVIYFDKEYLIPDVEDSKEDDYEPLADCR